MTKITIDAGDLAAPVTIDAGGLSRVILCKEGNKVALSHLAITGGCALSDPFGGGIKSLVDLLLANVVVTGNSAGDKGGGIRVGDSGCLTMVNCTVSKNRAPVKCGQGRFMHYLKLEFLYDVLRPKAEITSIGMESPGLGLPPSVRHTTWQESTLRFSVDKKSESATKTTCCYVCSDEIFNSGHESS